MASPFRPSFHPSPSTPESPTIQSLITSFNLTPHVEGGFFAETDRSKETIPSPFPSPKSTATSFVPQRPGSNPALRNLSTTIFYLLTPSGPQGGFHRNKGRTVHTLHRGRGRYVVIHADEDGKEKRVESFVVGQNVAKGESLQWIVDGGKYKASFLLPDEEGGEESESGLLISETVVPGFEYCDHDFLSPDGLAELLGQQKAEELDWLLSLLGKPNAMTN
ncbi:RmlC-like cupin domain-containing protein [Amylocarpus encephaloides]|uniref:RmlC-like cupin domain-containing protein n=1 Tax=Amylocarpus encephaloides TaxID=45428 RepID=A0A9P7YUJ0_9HELO|nr:RmlC-like cupin domain-containing protein [Amylocarpus encephaloides]